MSRWRWKVDTPDLERADRALLQAIESGLGEWEGARVSCSRSQIQRLIEEGQVTLSHGGEVKAKSRLQLGDEVTMNFPPPRVTEVLPEDRPLEILYQDSHIVVLNKPPGLTVHPSDTQSEGTLVNALLHHIRDLSGIGGELRPGIVHRIDKDTSGALVISKTDEAHRALAETFSKHAIEREYWALCYGTPSSKIGPRIETQIGRSPSDRKKMAILKAGGRNAISHFRKIESYAREGQAPFASWLAVRLETGRTHQVRVHLTSIGCSLLGDPVYGTPSESQPKWTSLPREIQEAVRALPGQALHARVLGFAHPISGEKLRFEAEVPEAFRKLQELLQKYSSSPR